MAIECLVLGAGQEVGKSCVVVSINGKKIMFDCGLHMGYVDRRRYPDFSLINKSGNFDNSISCIIITHFHLDHIGALPYFTEVCGYNGPIYMTYPTKALAPIMLEDNRTVMVDRKREEEQFTSENILECMKKVTAVNLKQTVQVDKDLQIRAYYAGHVNRGVSILFFMCSSVVLYLCIHPPTKAGTVWVELDSHTLQKVDDLASASCDGAAMFYAKVGDTAVVYTGDYNMTPDRHLGAAQIDRLQLDLLITESTYATTIRDSKYAKEREFLKAVHKCVANGGKVLIPTFGLGRAQELCILLDDYWERMNLKVPIYFSAGLTIQANMYYKIFINWTSQKVKDTYATRNAFDFKNVCNFDRSLIHAPGPCVLFATPGMISGGFSLEVFKHWAPCKTNLIALPGYCVAGTIGHKLMSGTPLKIDVGEDTPLDAQCQVYQLSFSPHTDAKGIMDLVKFLSPKNVMLVHGQKHKIALLKEKIQSELGLPCYDPANRETLSIPSTHYVKADVSDTFLRSSMTPNFSFLKSSSGGNSGSQITMSPLQVSDGRVNEGILTIGKNQKVKIVHQEELLAMLRAEKHEVQFAHCCTVHIGNLKKTITENFLPGNELPIFDQFYWLKLLFAKLPDELAEVDIQDCGEYLQVDSFRVSVCTKDNCPHRAAGSLRDNSEAVHFCCTWSMADEKLAWKVISVMKNLDLNVT